MAKAMEITGHIIDVTTTTTSNMMDQYWLLVRDEASGKKYPIYLRALSLHIPRKGDKVWLKGKLKTVIGDHGNVISLIKAGDLDWKDETKLAIKGTVLLARHMKKEEELPPVPTQTPGTGEA